MPSGPLRPGGQFVVSTDHPCLPGHFPGNPIVPGVVLLDEAFAQLQAIGCGKLTLLTAKFTAPVRPGEPVDVAWQQDEGRVAFDCSVGGRLVLRGSAQSP